MVLFPGRILPGLIEAWGTPIPSAWSFVHADVELEVDAAAVTVLVGTVIAAASRLRCWQPVGRGDQQPVWRRDDAELRVLCSRSAVMVDGRSSSGSSGQHKNVSAVQPDRCCKQRESDRKKK